MAIAKNMMNIDIPVMGAPFYHTEDLFYSQQSAAAADSLDSNSSPQEICISCKRKRRRVFGYLSDPISLEGQSEWKPAFNSGSLSAGGLMTKAVETLNKAADNGLFLNYGTSFQQPWMNRQNWSGSKPFNLNFSFNLISDTDGGVDVMSPAVALMSFIYPRLIDENEAVAHSDENTAAEVKLLEVKTKLTKGWQVGSITLGGPNTMIGTAANSLSAWHIPGPSIQYDDKNPNKAFDNGDPVTITIGDMFAFGGCYLKSVKLEMSPNSDMQGLPTWCKCTVTAQAMDANYCKPDGSFLLSGFGDRSAAISAYLTTAKKVTETAISDSVKVMQTTYKGLTFWGNSPKKESSS